MKNETTAELIARSAAERRDGGLPATVAAGVAAAEDWCRGSTAELSRWEHESLTARGQQVMRRLRREMTHEQIVALVGEAVAAGY